MRSQSSGNTQWEIYGEFGAGGHDVGCYAVNLLAALQDDTTLHDAKQPVSWSDRELRAFDDLAELDRGIRFIEPQPGLDGSRIGNLHRDFHRLFAASPFTEGERRWLFEPTSPGSSLGLPELVAATGEIREAGTLRAIHGADLVRRWWAWRRESDEFAGQNSLEEARQALGSMSLNLVSEKHWPAQHKELLGQLRNMGT